MNAISEIGSSNLLPVQGSSASSGDAAGAGGFAAQFAAAVQGFFGPSPALPGVPLGLAKGILGNAPAEAATPNSSVPKGPGTPRKNASASAASDVPSNLMPTAVAWLTAPQLAVPAPSVAGSASGPGSNQGLGRAEDASATAAALRDSVPSVNLADNAQATGGSLLPAFSLVSAEEDTSTHTTDTTSSTSQKGFADTISVAGPEAVGAPQVLDETRVTWTESQTAKISVSTTRTAGVLEGQDAAPGTQTTAVNPTNLTENIPPPTATRPEVIPPMNPGAFSIQPLVTQVEPAAARAPSSVADSSHATAHTDVSEKTSAFAAFTSGISSLIPGSSPPAGNAGQSATQPVALGGAVTTASESTVVTALSAGADMIAALASVQSAVSTPVIAAKPSMRSAAKVSTNDSPANVGSSEGAASSSASLPVVTANSSKNSPAGGETPFAIFFPPTTAAESVAAAFPKMMVPAATNASLHNNTQTSAGVAGTAPQNASVSGTSLESGATQPTKNSPSENSNQNAPSSSIAGHSVNSTGATAATDAAQTSPVAAAPPAAQPNAGGQVSATVVAQAGNAPPPAETTQKQESPPPTSASALNVPSAPQAPPQSLPGPVQVAQIASRAGQAEMRIGMNTSAFGSVEVRTVIHASDVGVMIGSEKGDLRGLLTNEMPTISNSLEQQNLRLSNVSFMQGFASGGDMAGGGNAQQQRSFTPPAAYASPNAEASSGSAHEPAELPPLQSMSFGVGSLSVLA